MIQLENHLGCIEISHEFFVELLTSTVTGCFGVAGMSSRDHRQGLRNRIFRQDEPDQGIRVRYSKQNIVVDLHIIVIYGMNITEVVKSIINKVRYTMEEVTGLSVSRVNVFIDGMKA
ncbi:hypothetical protein CLOSTMETH_00573 [[Clostridium] methylpentosum DSM 5476]|jgi:uncharacterized alkaline shock family protein YloU|uniref:Asp23/Gls24 family envelope stress response protein n=1 Tax=[Clostridium] methylpentosum DSM 5476 TaxID=537013 RepID=C0E9S2_9FIRM|nr:hypothetical protein CLOSTMETH_00573 [[Clostridium] methylpentosum DSM 5476]MDY3990088.1 Asp23/Gls24 family envelope stress response protein [Massilioclostridium sp.]MEE1492883.1 Asp23/Gls24 family envelope stress response protein [Massilioclostridium sp.]